MLISSFRKFALVVAIIGSVLFSSLFLISFANPLFVEQVAKEIIRYRLESVAKEKIDSLSDNTLISRAQALSRQYEKQIEQLKQELADNVPAKVAAIMAEMRNLDCECRKKTEDWLRLKTEFRISSLSVMSQQLTSFIQGKYMETAEHLMKEFRIFTGSSAMAFIILFMAVFIKRKASAQLLFPAVLLFLSTVICAYFYIFQQNWLQTILFSSYVGWVYLIFIGVVFAFLCDIVLNRCRVTSFLANLLPDFGGEGVDFLPC